MITGINQTIKHQQSTYHANVNVNFMVENVVKIKSPITITADASARKMIYAKQIIFGILLHVIAKMVNIQQILLTIQ